METQHQVHTNFHINKHTHQQQHISAGHKHTFHSNKTPFTAQISLQVRFSPSSFHPVSSAPRSATYAFSTSRGKLHPGAQLQKDHGRWTGRGEWSELHLSHLQQQRHGFTSSEPQDQDNRVDTYIYVPYTGGHHIQRQHHSRPLHSRGTHTNTQSQTHTWITLFIFHSHKDKRTT